MALRSSSHESGVATLDGDTKALEEESHGTRLPGCGGNPTAEVADKFRRFLSQRAQCLDGDWDEVVRRRVQAVLGPLPSFSLRSHGAWSRHCPVKMAGGQCVRTSEVPDQAPALLPRRCAEPVWPFAVIT